MPAGPAATDVFHQERLSTGPPLRVVGIGASAGAVEAFTRLLKALPADSGMAFVLLSHLSPTHNSELARLFSPLTRMPVQDALDGTSPEPNHVYVLPPDRILTLKDGRLRLNARDPGDIVPTSIDKFLESLAAELGPLAVGVILTGTGSDGTAGIGAIRKQGGVTYAQDPAVAASPGMPRSAIESGSVDFVLPLEEISTALAGLTLPPPSPVVPAPTLDLHPKENGGGPEGTAPQPSDKDSAEIRGIIKVLQTGTGIDFQHYKLASLVRRIRRRAETIGLSDLGEYLVRLRQDPAELSELYQVVLIKVTRFFREPEIFESLATTIIPALRLGRTSEPVRAWVVGCASGEEVYSLAISFLEVEAALGTEIPVRVFASDVSEPALDAARLGHYAGNITANVSAERLERFFTAVDGGYQVSRQLREMCVFARHDITRDPPFPQLDLVLCCNVLIYLDPVLQRRLLQNIHYALKPGGYLVLGPAETAVGVEGLFSVFDRKHQIYLRRVGPARLMGTREGFLAKPPQIPVDAAPAKLPRTHWSPSEVQRAAERAMFLHYPTASVVVNQEFEVLHYQGPTAPYLQAPTGGPTAKLLRLAHPELRLVLGRMLRRVKKDGLPIRRAGVSMGGKPTQLVNLGVVPVPLDESEERYYLIVFDPVPQTSPAAIPARRSGGLQANARLAELETELAESKEYLQVFIDQQDAANAEIQAAYEASLSVNEEYQSTNEELESAKEELQSLNEELTTMNEQMQQRNAELQARSAEVNGLLEALDMPLLLLTRDLRLRAYNSRAGADFHLTSAKIGHGLGESMLPMLPGDLRDLVERAFGVGEVQELELQDQLGRWRALRVWPIQPEGDGGTVAIAFVDIHKLKADIAEERDARSYSEAVVETLLDPLVVLDEAARMLHANRAFHRTFGTDSKTLEPRSIGELGGEDWDPQLITDFLARAAQADRPLDGPEVQLTSSRFGRRTFQLGAGTITWRGPRRILLALKDVTERKLAEEAAMETSRMQAVGQLAGGVAHEINNQMTVVIGLASFLLKDSSENNPARNDLQHILKAADRSASISQQLLAFSRRQMLQPVLFDLNAMVSMAETNLRPFLRPDITLEVVLGERVGQIKVDIAQMEQLLVNLAINARDAMEGPGRLRIETTTVKVGDTAAAEADTHVIPRGTYARLIVTDTGHGMNPATTARIFEPFFTTKGIGQGTGLGLASVYGVVKQSGGSIWVESTIGRGTTFTIDFPQVVAPSLPAMASAEPSSVQGGSETIMVVDDQELVRSWVARSLRELGYSTVEATDGFHALSLIAEGKTVNLVVSDVSMPGMDGSQLRNHLAELCPEVPILFMSGFALDDLVHRGRLEAGTHLMHKPFTADALAAKVREAIGAAKV
jgi:two-component system CheB/CheR fusion protein